jgi:hypothetical protein
MNRHVPVTKPSNPREFLLIKLNVLTSIHCDYVPQRHIIMAGGETYGRRARHHQRIRDVMLCNNFEFLKELAHDSFSGVFPRFNMAAGREPELGAFMIDEKDISPINDGHVRDQVLWRRRRLRGTTERRSRIDPSQRVSSVSLLQFIKGQDRCHFVAYRCPNVRSVHIQLKCLSFI